MKPIPLSDTAAVDAALALANGRASSHAATAGTCVRFAERAEHELASLDLPLGQRAGATLIADSGLRLPAAYKYDVTRTRVTLIRRRDGWALICATKHRDRGTAHPAFQLSLTPTQAEIARTRFAQRFTVLPA